MIAPKGQTRGLPLQTLLGYVGDVPFVDLDIDAGGHFERAAEEELPDEEELEQPPHAGAANEGDAVDVLPLEDTASA